VDHDCNCLLCDDPVDETAWDARDRRVAEMIVQYGWNVVGIAGDDETPGWAYSIGMWHTLRQAEVCVFGLGVDVAMSIVDIAGEQVRDGRPLRDEERRADVIEGYDVVARPVHPSWYRSFFGTAIDFYQRPPVPFLQLVWPDRQGQFPWDDGVAEACLIQQPQLWLAKSEHPAGAWTDHDPYAGWPFGTSLPYLPAITSDRVLQGAPIVCVMRDHDGGWRFLDDGAESSGPTTASLRQISDTHPYVSAVADLAPGEQAVRESDGSWARSPMAR
jgi:hypothetical protein